MITAALAPGRVRPLTGRAGAARVLRRLCSRVIGALRGRDDPRTTSIDAAAHAADLSAALVHAGAL